MSQPESRSTHRALRAALAAACLLVAPAASLAQGSHVLAQSGGGWNYPVVSNGGWACGNTVASAAQSASAFCHGGPSSAGTTFGGLTTGVYASDFIGTADASTSNGSLHASAGLGWFVSASDNAYLFPHTSAYAATSAQWTDQALLVPHAGPTVALPVYLDLTYRLTGTISSVAQWTYPIIDPATGLPNGTSGYIGFGGAGGTFIGSTTSHQYAFYDDGGVAVGAVTAPPNPIGGNYVLRVGIASLTSEVFDVFLAMSAQVQIGLGAVPQGTFTGSILADFAHTATPIGYQLFDAAGNDVTAGYGVTFMNGLQIVGPTAAVPEPATLLLLAAGLVGVAAVARRRR